MKIRSNTPKLTLCLCALALGLAGGTARALSISGQVADSTNGINSFGVSGVRVTVTYGLGSMYSTNTDANGNYTFSGLIIDTVYTVTPTKSGDTFSPPSSTVYFSLGSGNATSVDFSVAHSISGRVTINGNGLSGTMVTAEYPVPTDNVSTTTDVNGNYTLTGLYWGTPAVTPSQSGYYLEPLQQYVHLGPNATGINFTAYKEVCRYGDTLQGVDVYANNGNINWTNARVGSGISFAFARVSDGTVLDSKFAANYAGIKAAGLIRGASQYFEPGEDPVAQANILITSIGVLQPGDLAPALEVEVTGGQSAATIAANIQTWVTQVQAATGRVPTICTTPEFWDVSVDSTAFANNPLWPYVSAPVPFACPYLPQGWTNWVFWRDGASGTVSGISGPVDTDLFNGSPGDLSAAAGEPSLSISPTGTNMVAVAWSAAALGFALQQKSLLGATNWVSVTNAPSVVSNQAQVILGLAATNSFFRLQGP